MRLPAHLSPISVPCPEPLFGRAGAAQAAKQDLHAARVERGVLGARDERGAAARAGQGGRGGGLRLGMGRRGVRLRRGHRARLARRPDRAHQDRLGDLPDAWALARHRLVYEGETYTLPLPDGPGKPLKLTIGPVQGQIPIYIAAIGPKNMQLTGEIADGWLPVFFSPEHVDESRRLLEEGAARAARSLDDAFDMAPTVNVCIDDDLDRARDAMRHFIALYVGGMGSRERNFYNTLVQRYGFSDAARKIQDLYLAGKKDHAAAAVPAELIDTITLVGPRDRVRDRLRVYRDAGVGTLIVAPAAGPNEQRRMVRELAEML